MICEFKERTMQDVKCLDRIMEIAQAGCGINLHVGKRSMVNSRIGKRLRRLGIDLNAYVTLLEEDARERQQLIDLVTTNHTFFWREPGHFDHLAHHVLKPAKERAQESVRIWCCGCATGEEAWALAHTVRNVFPFGHPCDVAILATDISERALATAKNGIYPESRLSTVPALYRSELMQLSDRNERLFSIQKQYRSMVSFARLNLFDVWPMHGSFHAIFCRNVMMYFTKEIQQTLVSRFHNVLDPGGLLYLGHSESMTRIEHKFKLINHAVYSKP